LLYLRRLASHGQKIEKMGRKKAGAASSGKALKPKVELPADTSVDAFRPVAELIIPDPPTWLAEHLQRWSSTIFLGHAVELRQPTRAEMVEILTEVGDATALLRRALGEPSVREFLYPGDAVSLAHLALLRTAIDDVQARTDSASKMPSLVNGKGKAKAGRGRAQPPGAISAQTYCALFIAEVWKFFRGEYPAPRNREAEEAANLYWKLAGGKRNSWGNDPAGAWRPHLAKAEKTRAVRDRAAIQCHLREAAQQAKLLASDRPPDEGN